MAGEAEEDVDYDRWERRHLASSAGTVKQACSPCMSSVPDAGNNAKERGRKAYRILRVDIER